ncbi:NAD-dependent histone deacetylase sir2 [Sorochytrium milnesiophthora]
MDDGSVIPPTADRNGNGVQPKVEHQHAAPPAVEQIGAGVSTAAMLGYDRDGNDEDDSEDGDYEDGGDRSDEDDEEEADSTDEAAAAATEAFKTAMEEAPYVGEHEDTDIARERLASPDIALLDEEHAPPITPEEVAAIRADARRRGAQEFCHVYTFVKRYNLPRLITQVFGDQFAASEMQDVRETFLGRKPEPQLQELWACLQIAVQRFVRRRQRLQHVTTIDDVAQLLRTSSKIMVISGAGISVSCGIPDFRSKDGIYSRLDDYELDDPTLMFDLAYFKRKPETFYSFAKEIYPSNFKPSPSHMFVRLIEQHGKLLRNYTQNIDNIEELAGIEQLIQCHGSFRTARCLRCRTQVPGYAIEKEIFAKQVPRCQVCPPDPPMPDSEDDHSDYNDDETLSKGAVQSSLHRKALQRLVPAIMKPDIVFFGEQLPEEFHDTIKVDVEQVDLLLVIGSSLKVAPVSEILKIIPDHVPQVIINRELLTHLASHFDVHLLGNSDQIVPELCRRAGWTLCHEKLPGGTSGVAGQLSEPFQFLAPNIHLFEGGVLRGQPGLSDLDSSGGGTSDDDDDGDGDDDDGEECGSEGGQQESADRTSVKRGIDEHAGDNGADPATDPDERKRFLYLEEEELHPLFELGTTTTVVGPELEGVLDQPEEPDEPDEPEDPDEPEEGGLDQLEDEPERVPVPVLPLLLDEPLPDLELEEPLLEEPLLEEPPDFEPPLEEPPELDPLELPLRPPPPPPLGMGYWKHGTRRRQGHHRRMLNREPVLVE